MAVNTLDELSPTDYDNATAGIKAFRTGNKSSEAQHVLYDVLTNAGLSPESADEYINLELEDEGGW